MHAEPPSSAAPAEGARVDAEPGAAAPRDPDTLLHAVFAAAPDPIFAKDRGGRYLTANAAALAVIGRPLAEVAGRTDPELWPDRCNEALTAADRRVLAGASVSSEETVPDAVRGAPRTLLVSKSPLRDGEGRIVGLVAISRDIVGPVAAAEARSREADAQGYLLALDDRLRTAPSAREAADAACAALAERIGAAVVGLSRFEDEQGTVVESEWRAPGVPSTLGHHRFASLPAARREPIEAGEPVIVADMARDARTADDRARRMLGLGASVDMPLVREGRTRGVLFVAAATPRQWTPDEIAIIRATAERTWDAAERARAQAELAERSAHLNEAQRIGRLGSWEWDLVTGEQRVSPELHRIHGVAEGAAFPSRDQQRGTLFAPAEWDRLSAAMRGLTATGEPFELELDSLRQGEPIRVVVRGEAACDPGGAIERLRGTVQDVTDRWRAAAALLEREARFRAVFENAAVGVARVDFADEQFLEVNDALCEITGYRRDELVGRSWVTITHPDDVAPDLELFRRMERGEIESYSVEKRYIHKSGRPVWVRLTLSLVRNADDEPDFEICIVEDVSAAKAAEARQTFLLRLSDRLREGERAATVVSSMLGETFGVTRVGYGVIDASDGDFTIEHEWQEGHRHDVPGRRSFASFGPWIGCELSAGRTVAIGDLAADRRLAGGCPPLAECGVRAAVIAPIIREGRFAAAVYLHHHAPCDWTADDVRLVEEAAERAWAAVERERAEAALRESETQFRTVAEALPGMLFVAAPGEGNRYVNEGYRRFAGRSTEELLGHRWVDLMHPDDLPAIRTMWREALPAGAQYSAEARFRRHDGVWRWHAIRGLPVRDAAGRIECWVGTCIDIHDRRVAETALQQLNETLAREVERTVGERQEALRQLHEAQKLETIGQLTGGVAHDFNNLLTPVMASLDLLRRRHHDERSQRLIGAALQSSERAKTLVQRLLAFARRQTLSPRSVDLGALIEGMRDLIDRSLGPTVRVEVEIAPDAPPAHVDPNQLELALLNLAVNARDAMERGGTLLIRVEGDRPAGLPPGRYAQLTVTDTGEGMDAETLRRAVEPFFSTKATGKGTGLGLSMVHGLAAQSRGLFRLQSAPGEGTTARLWLPAADSVPQPAPPPEADAPASARDAAILVVDDEELVRTELAESLRELGYHVTEAASAAAALDALRTGPAPDLIVTDYMMPGMTGAELAATVRTSRPDMPVLMVTGYAQLSAEETRGLTLLAKPFRQADLARRVADLLAVAQPAAA